VLQFVISAVAGMHMKCSCEVTIGKRSFMRLHHSALHNKLQPQRK